MLNNTLQLTSEESDFPFGGGFAYHLFENSPDCVKVLDLDGRLVLMNAGGLMAMEIDNIQPLLGRPWLELWQGESSAVLTAMAAARAGGVGRFTAEAQTLKGNARWWDVIVSPINGLDGKPAQLLAISRDVTTAHVMARKHDALVHELEHRMKNMLAVVQSLAYQSFKEGAAIVPARDAYVARLTTLNHVYNLLAGESWTGTDLQAVIEAVLLPYHAIEQLTITGPTVHLSAQSATSFALAVNELAANAKKYGALSSASGQVAINWTKNEAGQFIFTWLESGGPTVTNPEKRGFGRKLVEFSLPSQFQGSLRYEFLPAGVELELTAPASAVEG